MTAGTTGLTCREPRTRPGVDSTTIGPIDGGIPMNVTTVIRYAILALSAALMVLGVLVIAGLLVPVNFPPDYRLLLGAVVFLYGAYRFSVAYFRPPKE